MPGCSCAASDTPASVSGLARRKRNTLPAVDRLREFGEFRTAFGPIDHGNGVQPVKIPSSNGFLRHMVVQSIAHYV